ncbi:MAG TPA: sugar ABC transporter ATP-binding protein [Acidothermaceae bacterium]|jgi:simple sugar transport system ATP-binding protein/ribose transport system ATP-binding protein
MTPDGTASSDRTGISGGLAGHLTSGPPTSPQIELRGLGKQFSRVYVLKDVSLTVMRGSVHALVGENGAGKSTLGKIVAGVYQHDEGTMRLDGQLVVFRSPREALSQGVAMLAQEPMVVPHLTIAENVLLGTEPSSQGFVRRRRLYAAFDQLASSVGFDLRGDVLAGRLRVAEQQQVEILRAISRNARVIVMDEPSAALDGADLVRLHDVIRQLAAAGKTIILISHFLREVVDLADRVTVLRDGRVVSDVATSEATVAGLVEAMLGRPLTASFPDKRFPVPDAPVALKVRHLHAPGVVDVSLEVHAGEIVGLAGLVGAGRTELARAIIGATRPHSGKAEAASKSLGRSPRESLRAGVAMIPESRKDDGLVLTRSVLENVTLSHLSEVTSFGIVRRGAERAAGKAVLTRCDVRGAGPDVAVGTLSGGNQQKVLFARICLSNPGVIIADEPTRGVDIGAKRTIYDVLTTLADEGRAVLIISSEIEEVIGLAHRVLVMRGGRIVQELTGEAINEQAILTSAFAEIPTIVEAS